MGTSEINVTVLGWCQKLIKPHHLVEHEACNVGTHYHVASSGYISNSKDLLCVLITFLVIYRLSKL